MKRTVMAGLTAILLTLAAVAISARPVEKSSASGNDAQLAKRVRHELVMLPYYGVFDNLAYSIDGNTVTLFGQVIRPSTRSGAEHAVKRLPGVARVVNNIKVLPLSGFDDDIRAATYRSIVRTGGLYRYMRGANPSLHIIVDRGQVTLEGVVSSRSDRNLAYIAARQVAGSFSVTNNIRVQGESELR